MTASISAADLALLYGIPVAAGVAAWLTSSIWVYGLTRVSRTSPLRYDLEHRVAAKRELPSGANLRLSFGYVALALLGDNCVQATTLYRLSRWLVLRRAGALARVVHAFGKLVTHADISPRAHIGPGLFLYHGLGTVIGKGTRIGAQAVICQNVTTGGGPTIGDGVKLWAGAKVIGRVSVGDHAEVGANGVVLEDVPANTIAVGVPATRFLPKDSAAAAAQQTGDQAELHRLRRPA